MKIRICIVLSVLSLIWLNACTPATKNIRTIEGEYLPRTFKPITGLDALQKEITTLLADPALAPANIGIVVSNLRDKSILFEHNSEKLFHPASTMKLYTSALALEKLGLNYTFATRMAKDSACVSGDTLRSNIYLIGGGDPVFSLADLAELTDKLQRSGVKYIAGDVVCDASFLDDQPVGDGWMWDDAGAWYSAPLSALSINENCIDVIVRPGEEIGTPAQVTLDPQTSYISIKNTSVTLDSARWFSLRLDTTQVFEPFRVERRWREKENIVEVSGNLGDWFAENRSTVDIIDPVRYFGTLFIEYCEKSGIQVAGQVVVGIAPSNR